MTLDCNRKHQLSHTNLYRLDSESALNTDFKIVLVFALASLENVCVRFLGGHFYYIKSKNKSCQKKLQKSLKIPNNILRTMAKTPAQMDEQLKSYSLKGSIFKNGLFKEVFWL